MSLIVRIVLLLMMLPVRQANAQVLECVDCIPTPAIQDNAVTPDKVLSSGQQNGYCLKYQQTGDTWQWGQCGQSWSLLEGGQTRASSVTSIDLDAADFDVSCTSGDCQAAASNNIIMDDAGMIGESADFGPTVDLRTKTLLAPISASSLPSTCTQGQVYLHSAGSVLSHAYYCYATNTWRRFGMPFVSFTGGVFSTGNTGIAGDSTQRWFAALHASGSAGTTSTNFDAPIPFTGKLYALSAAVNTAPGGSVTRTFTLLIGGSASAIACSITGTSRTCTDVEGNGVAVTAGDLVMYTSQVSGGTPAATDVTLTLLGLPDAF